MLKVGITGGIGTGKSTVCKIFATLGIPTYDADKQAKELYDTNDLLRQKVIDRFGEGVYENGVFQRQKMAAIVFADADALQDLNAMVHPLILAQGEKWFAQQKTPYAIKEAALLIESGGHKKLDKLIVVQTSLPERIARLKNRDNTTQAAIMNRIEKQLPEDEKATYADYIIHSNAHDFLIEQVLHIHTQLLQLCD